MTSHKNMAASVETIKTENKNVENCRREKESFQVVDYGEQLVSDIADVRDELHKEILSVIERVHLLWEIVRTFMMFILTVIGGLSMAMVLNALFPKYLAEFCFTASIGITIVLGFLTLNPVMEATSTLNNHRFYSPNFIDCHCVNDSEAARGGGDSPDNREAQPDVTEANTEVNGERSEVAVADGGEQPTAGEPETLASTTE